MATARNKATPADKKPATTALAPQAAPAAQAVASVDDIDISDVIGAGAENVTTADLAIPFLRVLQTNSPECDEAHAKFMKAAKPGMLLNTVTQELFDGKIGALFVPCHYERRQLRWAPRGSGGGGYRGEVTEVEALKARDAGKLVDHEGRTYFTDDGKIDDKKNDRLVDTRLHYGLVINEEGRPAQLLFPLVSTQIKKSKLFNSMMRERTTMLNGNLVVEPVFLYAYRVTTVKESNDKGSWYGVHFKLEGKVPSKAIYDFGKNFWKALQNNEVKVDLAGAAEHAETEGAERDDSKF
jgi:hypothetical protein